MAKTPKDPSTGRQAPTRPSATEDGPLAATTGGAAVSSASGRATGTRSADARPIDAVPAATPPPEDDAGLLGRPSRDDVARARPGADLVPDDGQSSSPSTDPGVERPGAADGGVFDLLDQPGETDGDPLSSFLDAAEAKLGRGTGLTDPSDQTNASPAHGRPSAAAEGDPLGPETLEQFEARQGVFIGPQEPVRLFPGTPPVGTLREIAEMVGDIDDVDPPAPPPADDDPPAPPPDDDGEVTGEADPPHEPLPEDEPEDPDAVTGEADPPHEPPPAPLPEEHAPLPQDLQDQLDADVARFGRLRRTGDDGATDPSEIESEVVGPVGVLPTHAELGESLFGQPVDGAAPSTGGGNVNPGADSQGAGAITPGEDQAVNTGPGRDDDPFAELAPTPEPPVGSEAPVGADPVEIEPSAVASPVDDGPDIPDAIGS